MGGEGIYLPAAALKSDDLRQFRLSDYFQPVISIRAGSLVFTYSAGKRASASFCKFSTACSGVISRAWISSE